MKRLATIVFAAVVLTCAAAVAQSAATAAQVASPLDGIRPLLNDLANAAYAVVFALAAWWLKQKIGIDITTARRDTFQVATTNAAGVFATTGDMGRAVSYLKEAAPDAIKHFQIPDEKLPEKIEAKAGLLEAGGATLPVMPGAVPPR